MTSPGGSGSATNPLYVTSPPGSPVIAVRSNVVGSALESNHVLKGGPGTFISYGAEIDPTAPTATYYLLLIDAVSAVNGTVTILDSWGIAHTNGVQDLPQFEASQGGIAFATGCVLALSTTRPALSLAGSYLWLQSASFT